MRAICIHTKLDSPYRGVVLLEGIQTPEDCIKEYIKAHSDEGENETGLEEELYYFFVHPVIAKRIAETPVPNIGTDGTAYTMSEFRLNLCAMWAVNPGFSMTPVQIDALVSTVFIAAEHISH